MQDFKLLLKFSCFCFCCPWLFSVSGFGLLDGIPIGMRSSAVGLKICVIPVGIKRYKSIIKKMRIKHDKIVLLAKTKLDTIKVLISKVLIDSNINYDKCFSVNKMLREYNEMKEKIKNSENVVYYIKTMETCFVSCKKNTANKNSNIRRTKQNILMTLSNCAICGKKKSMLVEN